MKIITYVSSVADEAPEHLRAAARIYLGAKDGFLPVTFHASDKHAARAKAQAHWDAEIAKAAARQEASARRVEGMKAARLAKADAPAVEAAA